MWVIALQAFIQLVVAMPNLIHAAQDAFNGKPGQGAKKKEFVMAAATTGLSLVKTTASLALKPEQESAILSAVSSLTDATVASVKAADAFRKPVVPVVPAELGAVGA